MNEPLTLDIVFFIKWSFDLYKADFKNGEFRRLSANKMPHTKKFG